MLEGVVEGNGSHKWWGWGSEEGERTLRLDANFALATAFRVKARKVVLAFTSHRDRSECTCQVGFTPLVIHTAFGWSCNYNVLFALHRLTARIVVALFL